MRVYLIQGIGYGFAAAVQPGPLLAYLIAQTLSRGWRHALPVALAPLVSDGPIIAIVLLLLSRVPPWFQQALSIAGGLFILLLAMGALRAWRSGQAGQVPAQPQGRSRGVLRAALMNALSPGAYLFWGLVTGPILLAGWREAPLHGIVFVAGFYGAMVLSLGALIVAFGSTRQLGARVSQSLLGVSALALAGFGAYQLWLGVGPLFLGR